MNSFVHKTLVVELQAGVADRFPVLAHLSYDPCDPFAVTLVFSHDGRVLARWQLDREMVTDGLDRPVGIGDVRLSPESRGVGQELRMEFLGEARADGGRHHAVVFAWAESVGEFLRETRGMVAPGCEEVRVDDFLADVLAGS
ncbi:SsgA family sporulation/cell division regulator [Streptomyces sp. CHD11]|uniref:SsgA family sporulation/cell division regulator n=1 Tax=Streptomyces sp. CHD11 TaxID=2741325 RepID=UPI001BFCD4EC|nr:SsgA family sporulation/cell division regulator [Streptomyces sp. CHD11]MBT3155139.1 SsgA family sporulation/cell division regulator [Streptomyces sp. CHD11]